MAHLKAELGEELLSSGVAAANALGLTTQMPVQQTFLSRTRSRKRYRFGKQEISLRQAPRWQFLLADRPAHPRMGRPAGGAGRAAHLAGGAAERAGSGRSQATGLRTALASQPLSIHDESCSADQKPRRQALTLKIRHRPQHAWH
jgi:hypothetical protein